MQWLTSGILGVLGVEQCVSPVHGIKSEVGIGGPRVDGLSLLELDQAHFLLWFMDWANRIARHFSSTLWFISGALKKPVASQHEKHLELACKELKVFVIYLWHEGGFCEVGITCDRQVWTYPDEYISLELLPNLNK